MKLSTMHALVSALDGPHHALAVQLLREEFDGAIEPQLPLQPSPQKTAQSVSTKRVQAFRERQKRVSETHETGDETFHETPGSPPSRALPSESRISSSSHVFLDSQTPAEEATESRDRKSETRHETHETALHETPGETRFMKRSAAGVVSFKEKKPPKDAEMVAKARTETERLQQWGGK